MVNGPRTLKLFKLNIINFISKSRQAVFIIIKFNSLPMFGLSGGGIINNKHIHGSQYYHERRTQDNRDYE